MKKLLTLAFTLLSLSSFSQTIFYIDETINNPSNCKSYVYIVLLTDSKTYEQFDTIYTTTTLKYKVLTTHIPSGSPAYVSIQISTTDSTCWCYDDLKPKPDSVWTHNIWVGEFDVSEDTMTECSPLSINDKELPKFSFYPNPVIDRLNIILPKRGWVKLTSMLGKVIYQDYVDKIVIDMSNLDKGIYFLIVDGYTYKIIK